MWRSMVAGVLAWSGTAWAQSEPVPAAVELGDFDCSGKLDEARLFTDGCGMVRVEIAFDVPEAEQGTPQPSTVANTSLAVSDVDGDSCQDLLVTVNDRAETYRSTDATWRLEDALKGAGDVTSDLGVVYQTHDQGGGLDDIFGMIVMPTMTCVHVCYRWITVSDDWYGEAEVCAEWHQACNPMW